MFPLHPMGMKRMDPYRETKWGLFQLSDDQISLSKLTSLPFATAPGFCYSAGRPVGERGPCLSTRTSQNAGGDLRGMGEGEELRGVPWFQHLGCLLRKSRRQKGQRETLWCLASTGCLWWLATLLVVLFGWFFLKLLLKCQMLMPFGSGMWKNEPLLCDGRGYQILT